MRQDVDVVGGATTGARDYPSVSKERTAAKAVTSHRNGFTRHEVREGDARDLSFLSDASVHLICTSPPYASLIEYPGNAAQLGNIASYDEFLDQMDRVWAECLRVLVPGGRVACVVGDVCLSRKQAGRHHVLPLSADFQVRARKLGFDNLTPIRWQKVSNIKLEASSSSRFLGKPNLPNGIVKNDLEHILFFRKPGGYRKPTALMEKRSFISTEEYSRLFVPVWTDVTGQQRRNHPAPYPVEIPRRLVRMFSFAGDTVLDPFGGTASTAIAAMETGRNSVSVEIEPHYVDLMVKRLRAESSTNVIEVLRRSPVSSPRELRNGR
ncbi:MAG TPA: site-specific DNA-methyltransferase [Dongiaceae bacterium]|nr:site-specific DNA-methyltransferase [Dongiaceae bacterium]